MAKNEPTRKLVHLFTNVVEHVRKSKLKGVLIFKKVGYLSFLQVVRSSSFLTMLEQHRQVFPLLE